MSETVLKVEGVSKKFCRRLRYSMYYGTLDVARGMLGLEARSDALRPGEFWAVQDVSFELKRGETLGLIGLNGSGKSTLLRLLNGIYQPDKGRIEIKGRVGALISVGAGFHPLMTGRENIYLNGAILGMSRREIDKKFDSIVEFADIGEFLDAPVKTYSSGMYVKLGFAVAIHCEPDILLVDEVLAVGDAKFQQKCFSRISSFKESGCTIVIVTHNMDAILRHTGRAILLDAGRIRTPGPANEAVDMYYSIIFDRSDDFHGKVGGNADVRRRLHTDGYRCFPNSAYNPNETRFGDGRASVVDFELIGEDGEPRRAVSSGEPIRFRYEVVFREKVGCPVYGFMIRTKDGIILYGNNTWSEAVPVEPMLPGDRVVVEFEQNANLLPGDYFITAGVRDMADDGFVVLDRRLDFVHLAVKPKERSDGIINLFSKVSWKRGILSETRYG